MHNNSKLYSNAPFCFINRFHIYLILIEVLRHEARGALEARQLTVKWCPSASWSTKGMLWGN